MTDPSAITNAFTVDVEDYYHVSGFAGVVKRSEWDSYPSRVVNNTRRVLKLLERSGVTATFFVLGHVAKQHPEIVKEIAQDGHEIACHSYWHRLVYDLTPEEFREDLRQSLDVLQQITGTKVEIYRAPSFSITRRSQWALDILCEEGVCCDSSIFPIVHDRYGIPGAEPAPHWLETAHGKLLQFPPSIYAIGRFNLPVSGGGYFRLLPYRVTRHCLASVNQRRERPFLFYIHPWEVDPDQPRIAGSRGARFRHYVNLEKTEAKLERLLADFSFASVSTVMDRIGMSWTEPRVADSTDHPAHQFHSNPTSR